MNKNQDAFDKLIFYVNTNLKSVESKNDAIVEITKLIDYIDSLSNGSKENKNCKLKLDIDNYIDLFEKSANLRKLMEVIVGTNIISQDKINKISDNKTMINMISAYCISNDMIEDDEKFQSDDSIKLKDSTSLYLNEISHYQVLTAEEEYDLFNRYKNGDMSAKETIINCNLRLVVKFAKRYIRSVVPFADLIQEGNTGLLKAVEKFDHTKGYKFSTYAAWWIMQSIYRSIALTSRTIRYPVHVNDKINHIKWTEAELRNTYFRDPTIKEIAEKLGISEKEVLKYYNLAQTISIDTLIKDDENNRENNTLEYYIKDDTHLTDEEAIKLVLKSEIDTILTSVLTEREKTILILRYDLDGKGARTLEQCGQLFNLTRERVRQIERRALNKVRRSIVNSKMVYDGYTDKQCENKNKSTLSQMIYNDNSLTTLFNNQDFIKKMDNFFSYEEKQVMLLRFCSSSKRKLTIKEISDITKFDAKLVVKLLESGMNKIKNNANQKNTASDKENEKNIIIKQHNSKNGLLNDNTLLYLFKNLDFKKAIRSLLTGEESMLIFLKYSSIYYSRLSVEDLAKETKFDKTKVNDILVSAMAKINENIRDTMATLSNDKFSFPIDRILTKK